MRVIGITCFNHVTPEVQSSLLTGGLEAQANRLAPLGCGNPRQVVRDASDYFGRHFHAPIQMQDLAQSLGTSLRCLHFSFDRIRGVTPLQALQDHRLNQLFAVLSDQPRLGLGRAIRACGLGETSGVPDLFEQEFGIDMPQFLHICCRAADDRAFRLKHPDAQALILPI